MSRERIVYDFCPKCGALTKNGICTSCQTDLSAAPQGPVPQDEIQMAKEETFETQEVFQTQEVFETQEVFQNDVQYQAAPKKKHTGLIVGLCVGASVFTFLLYIAVMMIVTGAQDVMRENTDLFNFGGAGAAQKEENGENADALNDFWEEYESDADDYTVFDNKESDYRPSAEDEYYVEIVDAIKDDLSYQVTWESFDVSNEKEQLSSRGIYPQLTGEIPNLDSLNASIEEEVLYYMYALEDYGMQPDHDSASAESVCYVTYMDENVLSIVLQEQVTIEGYAAPELHAINIDVKKGVILEKEDMLEYSTQLAQKVKAQNLAQNEGVDFISELSDEEILELLSGYDGVLFYTPLGMEIGFNYELQGYVGWVTVTLKDYTSFGNKL